MKKKLVHIILLFLFLINIAYPQTGFTNRTRSIYILDISKYVKYININDIDTFKITVLASDSSLITSLKSEASIRKLIQNKPIKIIYSSRIELVKPSQIVYIHKKDNYSIFDVFQKIEGMHTLLVSENYPYQQTMLNFIEINGKTSFELNEKKLQEAGLTVSSLFVAHAVKTEADWQSIYNQTEKDLQQEKKVVAKQKDEIAFQQNQINEQAKEIEIQKKLLSDIKNDVLIQQEILQKKSKLVIIKEKEIQEQRKNISIQNDEIKKQKNILLEIQENVVKQEEKITNQRNKINQQLAQLQMQRMILILSFVLLLLITGLGFFIYEAYRIKKKSNEQLQLKNEEIIRQSDKIATQNKKIMDSINYAQRIQRAVIPHFDDLVGVLDNFFIFYHPRDVVSGDFYWQSIINDEIIVVAADCTGHGVPGAFMSMLGITFLNDIVDRQKVTQPDKILNKLRESIIDALYQKNKEEQLRDGMDIAVCSINRRTNTVQFAGANNPMILIRNNELTVFKGDVMPVSIYENMVSFTTQHVQLQQGDSIYIFSDGYADQFGGENGKKFMIKRLRQTLLDVQSLSMSDQKKKLKEIFENWKGNHDQIDDVLLIGLKI